MNSRKKCRRQRKNLIDLLNVESVNNDYGIREVINKI